MTLLNVEQELLFQTTISPHFCSFPPGTQKGIGEKERLVENNYYLLTMNLFFPVKYSCGPQEARLCSRDA